MNGVYQNCVFDTPLYFNTRNVQHILCEGYIATIDV